MQQFESLLTPGRQEATPASLLQSAQAHVAWEQATTRK